MEGNLRCGFKSTVGLPNEVREKVHDHPCYSEEAHHFYARMHLAVAPACNIKCNYCNRLYDCPNESRPGVTSRVISPEQALRMTLQVAAKLPQLSVVGIAGPGDPLANPRRTFETFRLIRDNLPDVKLCLSTNGLALLPHMGTLKELGTEHVTITINMVDPEVGRDIYEWVVYKGRKYRGLEASRLLLERQLEGLRMLVENDILVKVNSVMIPGINDKHLIDVSKRIKELGVFLHNIMPLIPVSGTLYWDRGIKAPTNREKKALQDICEIVGSQMMRHCRQCRADSLGLLGEDLSKEFTQVDTEQIALLDAEKRARLRGDIDKKARAHRRVKEDLMGPKQKPMLIAVTTKGGGVINQHFGHAKEFLIYETSTNDIKLVDVRSVERYCGGPETCGENPDVLTSITAMLSDCQYMLCSRIGPGPRYVLEEAGIRCIEVYDRILEVIDQVSRYGDYKGHGPEEPGRDGFKCPAMLKLPEYQPKVRVYRDGDTDQVIVADMEGEVLEFLDDLLTLQAGDIRSLREMALNYCHQKYDVVEIDL